MARGKIEIKKIENNTNRQVTFSKRRNGLFKKAHELSILCDAKVSVIVVSGSSSSKSYEYHTPSTSIKEIVDLYQKTTGVDVWSSQYQKMEENLRKLKEANAQLRLQIRRRLGHSLECMSHKELVHLEGEVDESMKVIRQRKLKVISNRMETSTRKVRNEKNIFRDNHGYEPSDEEIRYWPVKNITDDVAEIYEPVIEFFDGVAPVLSLRQSQLDPSNYLGLPWQQI